MIIKSRVPNFEILYLSFLLVLVFFIILNFHQAGNNFCQTELKFSCRKGRSDTIWRNQSLVLPFLK